jgi:hypothetical protein
VKFQFSEKDGTVWEFEIRRNYYLPDWNPPLEERYSDCVYFEIKRFHYNSSWISLIKDGQVIWRPNHHLEFSLKQRTLVEKIVRLSAFA